MPEDRNYALEHRMATQRQIQPEPRHHSTVQPRAQGGQWREPVGTFDHAGKVPAGPPRYGEPVVNRLEQADAVDRVAVDVARAVDRINADIARVMALPPHMVKP